MSQVSLRVSGHGKGGWFEITPPDATLLMAALDRLATVLTQSSARTGFGLSSARAQLQVDTCPSLLTVMSFADTMLADADSLSHGGAHLPVEAKVKALDRVQDVPKK